MLAERDWQADTAGAWLLFEERRPPPWGVLLRSPSLKAVGFGAGIAEVEEQEMWSAGAGTQNRPPPRLAKRSPAGTGLLLEDTLEDVIFQFVDIWAIPRRTVVDAPQRGQLPSGFGDPGPHLSHYTAGRIAKSVPRTKATEISRRRGLRVNLFGVALSPCHIIVFYSILIS